MGVTGEGYCPTREKLGAAPGCGDWVLEAASAAAAAALKTMSTSSLTSCLIPAVISACMALGIYAIQVASPGYPIMGIQLSIVIIPSFTLPSYAHLKDIGRGRELPNAPVLGEKLLSLHSALGQAVSAHLSTR